MTECCICYIPLQFKQFGQEYSVDLKGNSQFTECIQSSSSKQASNFTPYQKNKKICILEKGEFTEFTAEFKSCRIHSLLSPLFSLSLRVRFPGNICKFLDICLSRVARATSRAVSGNLKKRIVSQFEHLNTHMQKDMKHLNP